MGDENRATAEFELVELTGAKLDLVAGGLKALWMDESDPNP